MYLKNKQKALSPLIATILLVAVSLSLAGILYSWSSQNAKETTTSLTETTQKWTDCGAVNLYIETGCRYDPETGISLILMDQSTVAIDENLTMTIIDNDNNIVSKNFAPNFKGKAMAINDSIFEDSEDLKGLVKPLQRIRIFVNSCPDKAATTISCN
jgi:flagellin-like protein